MSWTQRYLASGRVAVHVLCGYELVALHTALPTITALAHRNRHTWIGRLSITFLVSWITVHLLVEPSERL